jgi:hypothetical protein
MIRVAITAEAFDAVAKTLPLGTVAYEAKVTASGECSIWVERSALDSLELAVRLALLDGGEVRGLREFHAEVRAARDAWHAQGERATLAAERPWWRRIAGFGINASQSVN